MWSVKNLEVVEKPTETSMGVGRFHFSDRYSVFDWGQMPDVIEGKGAALCTMGAYSFEKLEANGVRTHYRGLVEPNGNIVKSDELEKSVNVMEFNLVKVFRPKYYRKSGRLEYIYSMFTSHLKNFLVPLEVIYRNGLPEGSSVFKRLEKGIIKLADLGLDHYPKPGDRLKNPIFDVSTKLEEHDRYLSWFEAQNISGLTLEEVSEAKNILLKVDNLITEIAARANLTNEDGKIELAMDDHRSLMVADVVGTLDECRFTYNGIDVSKEIARQFYKGSEWYHNVKEAKKQSEKRGIRDWRSICKNQPLKLDIRLKNIIRNIYWATANEYTELDLFDAPKFLEVIREYKDYLSRQ